jgi:hypothetical protein
LKRFFLQEYVLDTNNPNPGNENKNDSNKYRPLVKTKGEVKEIEPVTWDYMLDQLKIPQPELIRLRGAKTPCQVNGSDGYAVRFFNFDKSRDIGLNIKDYDGLNEHPELIEYEGYYVSGKGGTVIIKKWAGAETSFLEDKINNRVITGVGLGREKTIAQKALSGIVKFMTMGGFVLVLVVIAVLAILISYLLKGC